MTYQFKILKNKEVSSFKTYPSVIHIDRVVEKYDLECYREEESLKNIVFKYLPLVWNLYQKHVF